METACFRVFICNAEKGTDDKGYTRKGKKSTLPSEDLVSSTLVSSQKLIYQNLGHCKERALGRFGSGSKYAHIFWVV